MVNIITYCISSPLSIPTQIQVQQVQLRNLQHIQHSIYIILYKIIFYNYIYTVSVCIAWQAWNIWRLFRFNTPIILNIGDIKSHVIQLHLYRIPFLKHSLYFEVCAFVWSSCFHWNHPLILQQWTFCGFSMWCSFCTCKVLPVSLRSLYFQYVLIPQIIGTIMNHTFPKSNGFILRPSLICLIFTSGSFFEQTVCHKSQLFQEIISSQCRYFSTSPTKRAFLWCMFCFQTTTEIEPGMSISNIMYIYIYCFFYVCACVFNYNLLFRQRNCFFQKANSWSGLCLRSSWSLSDTKHCIYCICIWLQGKVFWRLCRYLAWNIVRGKTKVLWYRSSFTKMIALNNNIYQHFISFYCIYSKCFWAWAKSVP